MYPKNLDGVEITLESLAAHEKFILDHAAKASSVWVPAPYIVIQQACGRAKGALYALQRHMPPERMTQHEVDQLEYLLSKHGLPAQFQPLVMPQESE